MPDDETPSADVQDWRQIIRTERRRVGLTQQELARRAGLATATIRKYENGSRTAPRESLERILAAVQASDATVKRVLTDRGFHYRDRRLPADRASRFFFSSTELGPFMDRVRWPMFAANELGELVAANRVARRLWGIDLAAEAARHGRARASLLVVMCEPRLAARLVNWDAMVRHYLGFRKAVMASRPISVGGGALVDEIETAIAEVNPRALSRIYELWPNTPPNPDKVRWSYPVVWREPGFPDMHFQGVVTTASTHDAIGFNDWIPVDAATWTSLETLLARRDGE